MSNNLIFFRIVVKLKKGVSHEELEEGKIRQFFGKFGDVVKFEATVDIRNKCFITFKYAESAAIVAKENFSHYIVERPNRLLGAASYAETLRAIANE